jgi:hypothetical protein
VKLGSIYSNTTGQQAFLHDTCILKQQPLLFPLSLYLILSKFSTIQKQNKLLAPNHFILPLAPVYTYSLQ